MLSRKQADNKSIKTRARVGMRSKPERREIKWGGSNHWESKIKTSSTGTGSVAMRHNNFTFFTFPDAPSISCDRTCCQPNGRLSQKEIRLREILIFLTAISPVRSLVDFTLIAYKQSGN